MPTIYRGENRRFSRTLYLADGTTELLVASLAGARVQIVQGARITSSFVLGTDAELRAGTAPNELLFDLSSEESAALVPGMPLSLRWTIKIPDADFVADAATFLDISLEEVADVGL